MADRNVAQVEVDNWKAEVSKLTHQQTGREAERALKRQIDGFLAVSRTALNSVLPSTAGFVAKPCLMR